MDKISSGRTTLTIAHRVKTIFNANNINVLDHGKLQEKGKFSELNRFKDLEYDVNEDNN